MNKTHARRAAAGLCLNCEAAPTPGKKHCEACRARNAEASRLRMAAKRTERLAAGVCATCGTRPPAPTRTQCDECVAAFKARYAGRCAALRAKRKAAGTCGDCGKRPPAADGAMCEVCRGTAREYYGKLVEKGLCATCGQPSIPGRALCGACRHKRDTARKERSANGQCSHCTRPRAAAGKTCETCRDRRREYCRELRHVAITTYGGYRCACPGCAVTEPQFLQIDHINNDGAAHRREAGHHLYAWLKAHGYPPGFQVLCANCNFAKGHYGQCPHVTNTEVPANDAA